MIDLLPLQRLFAAHPLLDTGCALLALLFSLAAARLRARPWAPALCLAGAGLALGLPMAADGFLHAWDERYHALVASHLLAHPLRPTLIDAPLGPLGLDWVEAEVWLHKPPLALWLMALGRAAFGPGELSLRIPSLLLHGAAVVALARLGPLLLGGERGRDAGLLAAFLFAINGELLSLVSGRVPTDHPDAVLISVTALAAWAAAVAARSEQAPGAALGSLACGLLCGAAVLAKGPPGLCALLVLAGALPLRARPLPSLGALLLAVAACALVALPWLIHVRQAFPREASWEADAALRHFTEVFEGHRGGMFFHLARIPRFFGEACPAALLWVIARRSGAGPGYRALALWAFVPYAVFSFAATKMDAYPLVAAPALCLAIGDALSAWLPLLREGALRRGPRLCLGALCAALLLLPARFALERLKPGQRSPDALARSDRLRAMAERLGPGPGLLSGADEPISVMYYTGWTALGRAATEEERARALSLGWRLTGEGHPPSR